MAALNRALKSAINATSASLRLTKKDNAPLLILTIVTTLSSTSYSAFPPSGSNNDHGLGDNNTGQFGEGNRETIVTQEVPVKVLPPDAVSNLHEPRTREPDVHIQFPPLTQLKSISDRFTKLAQVEAKSGPGSNVSRTRLEMSANMHGCFKISVKTDAMSISSVWTDLFNPELDPSQIPGGEIGVSEHPSTRMKQLGTADGRSEEGWATVRIDARDWGKVMSAGRLGTGRVIGCFAHEHALVLYVYLTGETYDEESVLTYYISSYSA